MLFREIINVIVERGGAHGPHEHVSWSLFSVKAIGACTYPLGFGRLMCQRSHGREEFCMENAIKN